MLVELSIFYFIVITIVYCIEEYRIRRLERAYNSLLKALEKQIKDK